MVESGLAMCNARHILLFAASMLVGLVGCDTTEPAVHREEPRNESNGKTMKVTIGNKTFKATLDDGPASAKLRAMLPMTLDMAELNGNEKHSRLPAPLPTDATDPGTIRNGELMLWGADTLVLFYKGLPTTYSYTRLGRIDDPDGLAAAVGSGGARVTFETE